MSFPYMQNDLNQSAQLQKLNQLQQLSFSPQINQRNLNPLSVQQQQQQAQQQQAQVQAHLQAQAQQLQQQQQVQQLQQQQAQQQQAQQVQQQAQVQQHQQLGGPIGSIIGNNANVGGSVGSTMPFPVTTVKEVWKENFHQEFAIIRQLITQYNYVSFSTEFPGILARPIGVFTSTNDYHYQTLRTNTDLLNLIQFGISLSDVNGKKPDNIYSTWQFNFKFDLNSEMISNEAYESLIKTGIDFNQHLSNGIDQFEFAELLTSSGLVLLKNVHWTSFHSGYDFGFLISLLTNNDMPNTEDEFINKIQIFFPNLFDLKILSKIINSKDSNPKLSLENLADELNIPRLNIFVSTGGQALLTNLTFIELKNKFNDLSKFNGLIHGLSNEAQFLLNNNNNNNNNNSTNTSIITGNPNQQLPSGAQTPQGLSRTIHDL
ncbi:CCR4-NOT transcription complex subunit 7 [Wickerhamomyces ciferrii]|uniref:poly(A)-specific ribonuclease n=1 Tax=Wickerhamomyces ciferrii (strain ATCC 14091 / BCRC 22168 / CBS 111 / JCM 3599 / NBRC 0793 / NRRL Y-1031 F-60-10) TaxID=1206466 RepID=K0KMZ1_WICCF|nr:CCR4-NOT transcription complex subunit 7 [Wickerhamomyces ciferrii]CCH44321.1 CCR4-NOT transcription complex subunit 7 [Wickerhamomyces ciferrii]